MKTFLDYAVTIRSDSFPQGAEIADIWIARVPFCCNRLESVNRGKMLRPIVHGVKIGSPAFFLWLRYVKRCCRAWNALALAAELNNLDARLSPLNAYDLAMCDGEVALASLILRSFDDDPEIDWSRTQANGLYCDPSIPF